MKYHLLYNSPWYVCASQISFEVWFHLGPFIKLIWSNVFLSNEFYIVFVVFFRGF